MHTEEYPLFSAASFVQTYPPLQFGPYEIRIGNSDHFGRPSLYLFVDLYPIGVKYSPPDHSDSYHAGSIQDELAALISLLFGIKLAAGERTRTYHAGDYRGQSLVNGVLPDPIMRFVESPIVPSSQRETFLCNVPLLSEFYRLGISKARKLVKAARLYQQALSLSDENAEYSWLFLVSSIESLAQDWAGVTEDPETSLQEMDPMILNILCEHSAENAYSDLARHLIEKRGVIRKFTGFLLQHLPPPPSLRPPAEHQLEWQPAVMKKTFTKIYQLRSEHLHQGKPIPAPMCLYRPGLFADGSLGEILPQDAYRMKMNTWQKKDLPMLLQTFEYIVRWSIIDWWCKELAIDPQPVRSVLTMA